MSEERHRTDSMKENNDDPVSHDGHRDRLRAKYIKSGADSLATHELLEIFLFQCVQRRNTNDIAHRMLERFGSLDNLLNAGIDELCQFDYISEKSAVTIKMVRELNQRCVIERSSEFYQYDSVEKIGDFLVSMYGSQEKERVYLLLFDSKMRLIDCALICDGSIDSSNLHMRKILECIILSKASAVVLAHNHPGGIAVPSREDMAVTRHVESFLQGIDTKFLAHFIVANGRYSTVNHVSGFFDITV